MTLVRRLVLAAMKFNVNFQASHIPGKKNIVADALSRLQMCEARAADHTHKLNQQPDPIPPHLLPKDG